MISIFLGDGLSKTQPLKGPVRSPFGERLIQLRTARGLTQEKLASASKNDQMAPRSITNYEQAHHSPAKWILPHRTGLRLLSEALQLDDAANQDLANAWQESHAIRKSYRAPEAETLTTDFITDGRESKTAMILEAWNRAANGSPQIVLLGGISGVGKTSLMHHICDRIAATHHQVMIGLGGASSWATAVEPYLPISAATDHLLIAPDANSTLPGRYPSRPVLSERHIAEVMSAVPHLGNVLISARTIQELASTSKHLDAEQIKSRLAEVSTTDTSSRQEEYLRLLLALSKSWPLLIVLEDMHWADEATVSLLLYISQRLQHMRDTPIMIVCTYRSNEVLEQGDSSPSPMSRLIGSLGYGSQVTTVHLNESMERDPGLAYIRRVIERTPLATAEETEHLAEWLYDQTTGHPLLTNELVQHLITTGVLTQSDPSSPWTFRPKKESESLPPVISTFAEQRLRRISREARRILEIASVMDDAIFTDVIASILGTEEDEVIDIIDRELVDAHRLLVVGDRLRKSYRNQISYQFPHALFREHIYTSLSQKRRKRLHQSIAEALDRESREADSTVLRSITSHYTLAENWHSAQMSGYRLAQDASIRLDWDLANQLFNQSEELAIRAQDPNQLWRSRAARLAVMRGLGQYNEAIELGGRILHLADIHNWPQTLALANHHLGEIYYDLGKIEQAVNCLEAAIRLHVENGDFDLAAAGEAMLSHTTHRQGRFDVARVHAERALKFSRELKNSWVQPEAVLAAANCETELGLYEQAMESYQIAIELAGMIGKLANQFIPAMNIGLCQIQLGRHQEAAEGLEELIARLRSQQLFRLASFAHLYLGYAYEGLGQLDDAADVYAMTTAMRRAKSQAPILMDSIAGELRVALKRNDDEKARTCLSEISDHLEEHGWQGMEEPIYVLISVAKGYLHFGDEERYWSFVEQAHELMMSRADMLEDVALRENYLTNVPVNQETQDLFANREANANGRDRM